MTKKVSTIPQPDDKDMEIQALQDRLARALADYRNLETRMSRDSSSLIKFANANLLEKLLEVRDHLGFAAVATSSSGKAPDQSLSLILSTFDKILSEEGVTTIRSTGEFDPHLMECAEEVMGDKDQIIKTLRPGYMLHDRILRPARVTVGNGSSSVAEPAINVEASPDSAQSN